MHTHTHTRFVGFVWHQFRCTKLTQFAQGATIATDRGAATLLGHAPVAVRGDNAASQRDTRVLVVTCVGHLVLAEAARQVQPSKVTADQAEARQAAVAAQAEEHRRRNHRRALPLRCWQTLGKMRTSQVAAAAGHWQAQRPQTRACTAQRRPQRRHPRTGGSRRRWAGRRGTRGADTRTQARRSQDPPACAEETHERQRPQRQR